MPSDTRSIQRLRPTAPVTEWALVIDRDAAPSNLTRALAALLLGIARRQREADCGRRKGGPHG